MIRDYRRSGMPDGFTPPFPGESHLSFTGGYDAPQETRVQEATPALPPGTNPALSVGPEIGEQQFEIYRVSDFFKHGDASNIGLDVGVNDVVALQGSDSRRIYLSIQNDSTGTQSIWFCFGTVASSENGTRLGTGGTQVFDTFVPQNDLHVIASAAGARVKLCFSNKPIPEGAS